MIGYSHCLLGVVGIDVIDVVWVKEVRCCCEALVIGLDHLLSGIPSYLRISYLRIATERIMVSRVKGWCGLS